MLGQRGSYSPRPEFLSPPSPPGYTKFSVTEGGTAIPYELQGTAENAGDFLGLSGADPLEVVRRVSESWLVDDAKTQYEFITGREKRSRCGGGLCSLILPTRRTTEYESNPAALG
jgi:hypothetical protein